MLEMLGLSISLADIGYNIRDNMSTDGRFVNVPKNVILEVKFSERDIIGTVK